VDDQEAGKMKWPRGSKKQVYVLELISLGCSIPGYQLKEWMEVTNPRHEAIMDRNLG
jgi:hypothetical protein